MLMLLLMLNIKLYYLKSILRHVNVDVLIPK